MNVREVREASGLQSKEFALLIRREFPGYDRQLQGKVERPAKYGIRLTLRAEKVLREKLGLKPARKPETRRQVTCRMEPTQYDRLQQALKADGFETVQDGVGFLISQYIKRKELWNAVRRREHGQAAQ